MENICKKCHELSFGCCQFNDSQTQIGIFYDDILKIKDYTKKEISEFIIKHNVDENLIKNLASHIHPIFHNIYHSNTSFTLTTIDNKCIFLTTNGCELPNDYRPLYCRIYPFFPSLDFNDVIVLSSHTCLAQNKSTLNWNIVNEHFGYDKEYLINLFNIYKKYSERHIEVYHLLI